MNILLTGGAGYVGSHTVIALVDAGHTPFVFDNFSNIRYEVISRIEKITNKNLSCTIGDTTNAQALTEVLKVFEIDAVIHFAALKSVSESVQDPIKYYKNNMSSFLGLIEAMDSVGCKNLIFSSSCTVYGEPMIFPIIESAPLGYANPYGHTKLMAEEILQSLFKYDQKWRVGILRYFNPVGAHESGLIGEDSVGNNSNLMPLIAQVALGNRNYIKVYGGDYPTIDGSAVRDYLHVMDIAEGHVASLNYLMQKGPHIVNLGRGVGTSVIEMLKAYEIASGKNIPYQIAGRRLGDVPMAFANPALAEQLLGWQATRSLIDMCSSSWKWQSMNPFGYNGSNEISG
jgi:UDP-glucose 4-epimerase